MLHPVKIRMTFKLIRARGTPETCRNCFTRDEMGSEARLRLFPGEIHYTVFLVNSGFSRTVQQLKIDIVRNLKVRPQLLHGQRGDETSCRRHILARPSSTPSLTSGSLFFTSRHTTNRQRQKGRGKGNQFHAIIPN